MTKSSKHIQIVRSANPELHSVGVKTSGLLREVLSKHYKKVGETMINKPSDINRLIKKNPDLVFVGVKNNPIPSKSGDEKLTLVDHLEKNNINYTGSGSKARNIAAQKDIAKQVVRDAKLSTAGFFVTKPGQYHSSNTLPLKFPLFIKPPHRGHGIGIDDSSVVRSFAEYEQKIESILVNYSSSSLVEQYLSGREFSVAILEQPNGHESLVMPVEIIAQENSRGDRILGHRIKNQDKEEVIAVDTEVIKNCVSVLAKSVFIALGGKGYGRVDIRMSDAGTAYFLEANLSPGLGQGYLARACEINKKMSYETMILKIAELGLA
jgi:D-alanine-D-alanine ligase